MKARNGGLLVAVGVLVVVSLVIGSGREEAEFAGADSQAMAVVTALHPDYQPWFHAIWEPPSGEIEGLLFALQAALGAGVLGYYLGFRRGQSRPRKQDRVDAGD